MSAAMVRKAIEDACLTVRDCVKAYGTKETAAKDWASVARAKSAELPSTSAAELGQYQETFEIAAKHAAALAAELN